MKILIFLLLFSSICFAEDIILTPDFTLHKPDIDKIKKLSKDEQVQVENALKEQGRKLIHIELKPAKNDYEGDFDRGTVEYTPNCHNYSYHKVVMPDGTTIRETNFTQRTKWQAIEGKNLIFESCNLVNVEIDPTWILKGCNTSEHDFTKDTDSEPVIIP